tara:strand:+ start:709 stop:1863 length:1155 start_codon:yes stop_codon:yes gene_type:complete
MKRFLIVILSYIIFFFNTNLISNEKIDSLKVGLLVPFSGEYKNLGNSIMFSIQMALNEIGDDKLIIIPRDSGSGDKIKLNQSITEIINEGAKIIIGPISHNDFSVANKYKEIIFISPSNLQPNINKNIISIGISLESQLGALNKFIKKQNKKKTVILYPNNEYTEILDQKIKSLNLKNYKIFKYNPDPKVLTGEIEKLTNYSQRKRNLELRKKILEKKEDIKSVAELKSLEQKYTLGPVSFDSLIIIDFGNSLKSVLTSLIFSDVNQDDVLITTVNQWFDKSIFLENSLNRLFYPSVNYKNFQKYNKKYLKTFNIQPSEITVLTYDALGLIYFVWKKNKKINSINNFFIKEKIKGKIGTFSINDGIVKQDLDIYKIENKEFTKF